MLPEDLPVRIFKYLSIYMFFSQNIFRSGARGGVAFPSPFAGTGALVGPGASALPRGGGAGGGGGAAVHPPAPAGRCRGSDRSGLRGVEAGGSPSPPCDRPQHPRDARNSDGV